MKTAVHTPFQSFFFFLCCFYIFIIFIFIFGYGFVRITIVFLGEGAAQNGRMAETLNAAAKEKLPLLFLVIDNGRAINTFTPDVAANSDVFLQVQRYNYCYY